MCMLISAAVTGHVGIARILLAFDADIDAKDSDGRTALMVRKKKSEMIK